MTVLITGSNGFVGQALCERLQRDGFPRLAAFRSLPVCKQTAGTVAVGDISSETDWSSALKGIKQVVHLAARVHVMNRTSGDLLREFRQVNVGGTANLARVAAASGVSRFVYLSSVKVNGEYTVRGSPYTADDVPAPIDAYAISKNEAEQALRAIAEETGMEVVIIRPPLVYGPRVKANFHSMMNWLARGVPLPLGAVTNNRRSLVALDNLVDLIVTCLNHPAAANQTFLVSDGECVSTTDLLLRLGNAIGKPARLVPVPPVLLRAAAMLLGKGDMVQRLLGNLQLDMSHTCQTLDWKPPICLDEGLHRAVQGFHQ